MPDWIDNGITKSAIAISSEDRHRVGAKATNCQVDASIMVEVGDNQPIRATSKRRRHRRSKSAVSVAQRNHHTLGQCDDQIEVSVAVQIGDRNRAGFAADGDKRT